MTQRRKQIISRDDTVYSFVDLDTGHQECMDVIAKATGVVFGWRGLICEECAAKLDLVEKPDETQKIRQSIREWHRKARDEMIQKGDRVLLVCLPNECQTPNDDPDSSYQILSRVLKSKRPRVVHEIDEQGQIEISTYRTAEDGKRIYHYIKVPRKCVEKEINSA